MSVANDLRHAVRSLGRSPGFTVVAVLTLALGLAATTAIFTVIKRVVLDPLPYPEAERLVRLKNQVPGVAPDERWDMAAVQYFYLGEQARSIEEIGAYNLGGANVQTPAGAQRALTAAVSVGAMRMIGAGMVLGRGITEADDAPGATPVAIISHQFWQEQFGGRESAVGQTLQIQGMPIEIVGVLEPGTDLPREPGGAMPGAPDIWLPLAAVDRRFNPEGPFYNNHTNKMFARLAPGVTPAQAQAELDRLTARMPEEFPDVYSRAFFEQYGFRTQLLPMKRHIVGNIADSLWIVFGAVGLVLLVASANVANLLLVRAEGRRRELALRAALGAGRGALARQFLAEGLVLAFGSAALALVLSIWGTQALASLAPPTFPRLHDLRVDTGVMLFTLGLALVIALALALFPILRAGRAAPLGVLADGGRGSTAGRDRQRVRSALIITQVALALVLIVGAGLLVESFRRLRAVDPGLDPEGVVTMELSLSGEQYGQIPAMWRFYDAVLERVRALPGVAAAGMSQTLPLTGGYGCTVQGFEDARVMERLGDSELTTCAGQEPTTPGYFEAMGIPLLRGRTFSDADNDQPSSGAVVVSRAFAERFWPGEDALGKGVAPGGNSKGPFYRVVGVVGDVYSQSPVEEPAVAIYYPVVRIPETSGWWPSQMRLVVAGLVAGGVVVLGVTRVMRSLLFGVEPSHPASFVLAATILLAVALLASYLPARSASRVDPITALRCE